MGEKERSAAEDAAGQPDAVPPLPPGVKLVRTLRGHKNWIGRIAWSPDGRLLASPSADKTIRLWDGTEETSFPPLLQGRVYADFREPLAYFLTAFDLILSLYEIPPRDPAVADLRESLGPGDM